MLVYLLEPHCNRLQMIRLCCNLFVVILIRDKHLPSSIGHRGSVLMWIWGHIKAFYCTPGTSSHCPHTPHTYSWRTPFILIHGCETQSLGFTGRWMSGELTSPLLSFFFLTFAKEVMFLLVLACCIFANRNTINVLIDVHNISLKDVAWAKEEPIKSSCNFCLFLSNAG